MLCSLFKSLKTLFCLLLFMAPCASIADSQIKIMLYGDSLMAGYGLTQDENLASTIERKFATDKMKAWLGKIGTLKIINSSVSGNTSNNGLARIAWSLGDHPDIVVLCLGANDMLRGIDPALTKDNLNKMIIKIKENGAIVVLAGMQSPESMGENYQSQFDQLYVDLAKQHNTIFMPFLLESVALKAQYLQRDFKHPNALGITVIANNLHPYLIKAIASLRANKIKH